MLHGCWGMDAPAPRKMTKSVCKMMHILVHFQKQTALFGERHAGLRHIKPKVHMGSQLVV